MRRRTFVLTAVSAGTLGLAGCSGGDDGGGDSEDGAGSDDGSDGTADSGSGDGGTSDGGSSDDSGSDDGTTDDGSDDSGSGDDGMTDGDGSSGDGGSDGGSDDGTTDGGSGDDGTADGRGTTDGPAVGEHTQWTESFVAEMSFDVDGQTGSMTIRSSGGNYHQTIETQQGTMEIYQIDGDIYFVQGEQCFMNPGDMVPDPETGVDIQDQNAVTGSNPDLTPAGRETIDGEEMYVYETSSNGTDVTIYISTQSGYIRRVETPQGTIEYHSWGEVGTIEAPDLDCQSM